MTTHRLTADRLIGTWQLLRSEAPLEFQSGTQMAFATGNQLTYLIPTPNGTLQVPLHWRVENGTLHTWNEDGTNPVAVSASIGEAEVLVFDFGGPRAFFVRCT